ncbi:hypothetical protein AGMMS49921_01130 [Endomicrobiia bacterium]|nr:hypothetical protein AGMMS49921_01130 [Endomicrobiia bacterium]
MIGIVNRTKSKRDSDKNNKDFGDQSRCNKPSNILDESSNGHPSLNSIANANSWRDINKNKSNIGGVVQGQIYKGQTMEITNRLLNANHTPSRKWLEFQSSKCYIYTSPEVMDVVSPKTIDRSHITVLHRNA